MTNLTLGSLFDGSGGFPLGGLQCGITPVWASEIEPFPIRVTTKRLPFIKHYGNVCDIDGTKIQPVDIITFGSPCTDMSVAGKRAGLDGTQSVLFYEAIRIIQEMRRATNGQYPRFIVWENVPGAFSSNKGADFKAVIETVVQIAEPGAQVPAPDKIGWSYADILVGDGWSVAYRTLDAQYFGVAQRRRRIYLVADFRSECAGDILFEPEGLYRDTTPCFLPREGVTGSPEGRAGTAIAFEPGAACRLGGHCWEEFTGTLRADTGDNQLAAAIENHPIDGRIKIDESGTVQTLTSRMGTGGMNVPLTLSIAGNIIDRTEKSGCNGLGVNDELSFTLNTADRHAVVYSLPVNPFHEDISIDIAGTLSNRDYKDPPLVSYGIDRAAFNQGANALYRPGFGVEQAQTLVAKGPGAVAKPEPPRYIVRRLTPTECALLQGFPADWCSDLSTADPSEEDIRWWADVFETHRKVMGTATKPKSRNQIIKWLRNPHSDAAEYKMWGNGVALPCVCYVLSGIVSVAEK